MFKMTFFCDPFDCAFLLLSEIVKIIKECFIANENELVTEMIYVERDNISNPLLNRKLTQKKYKNKTQTQTNEFIAEL